MIDGDVRYHLSSWNASSASSVQTKVLNFRRSLKNRRAHSANLEINYLSAAKHPMSFCTSLMRVRGHIASIVFIFSRLASVPWYETGKPCSLSAVTPKTHLSRFNFVHIERNLSKTKARLYNKDACDLILTMMLST
jgi:hypothetical protein